METATIHKSGTLRAKAPPTDHPLNCHNNCTWTCRYEAEGAEEGEAADVAEEAEVAEEPVNKQEAMPVDGSDAAAAAVEESSLADGVAAASEDEAQDLEAVENGEEAP